MSKTVKESLFDVMCELGNKEGFPVPFGAADQVKGIDFRNQDHDINVKIIEESKICSLVIKFFAGHEPKDTWADNLVTTILRHFPGYTIRKIKYTVETDGAVNETDLQNKIEVVEEACGDLEVLVMEALKSEFATVTYDDDKAKDMIVELMEKHLQDKGLDKMTEVSKRAITVGLLTKVRGEFKYDPVTKTFFEEADPELEDYDGEEDVFDPEDYAKHGGMTDMMNYSSKFFEDDAEIITPEIIIEEQKMQGLRDSGNELTTPNVTASDLTDLIKDLDPSLEEAKEMIESMKDQIIKQIGQEGYDELAESILNPEPKEETSCCGGNCNGCDGNCDHNDDVEEEVIEALEKEVVTKEEPVEEEFTFAETVDELDNGVADESDSWLDEDEDDDFFAM